MSRTITDPSLLWVVCWAEAFPSHPGRRTHQPPILPLYAAPPMAWQLHLHRMPSSSCHKALEFMGKISKWKFYTIFLTLKRKVCRSLQELAKKFNFRCKYDYYQIFPCNEVIYLFICPFCKNFLLYFNIAITWTNSWTARTITNDNKKKLLRMFFLHELWKMQIISFDKFLANSFMNSSNFFLLKTYLLNV